jgi:hypothetical protein
MSAVASVKTSGVFVIVIPFSLAAFMSILPKPTAPFAIIFMLLESFEMVSELIGSVTELKIPSKSFDPPIISLAV